MHACRLRKGEDNVCRGWAWTRAVVGLRAVFRPRTELTFKPLDKYKEGPASVLDPLPSAETFTCIVVALWLIEGSVMTFCVEEEMISVELLQRGSSPSSNA
jgi:hypothetical protein